MGETALWPRTFKAALNKLGGRGEGRARDSGLFDLMKTLLLCHCVPFGLAECDPVGFGLGAGPEDILAVWYLEKRVCI